MGGPDSVVRETEVNDVVGLSRGTKVGTGMSVVTCVVGLTRKFLEFGLGE